jgi:hypothetical protein
MLGKYVSVILLLSLFLGSLGFNTLDAMIWNFYNTSLWKTWHPFEWHMNTYFHVEVWNAYLFFGILPLAIGSMLAGYCIGKFGSKQKENRI